MISVQTPAQFSEKLNQASAAKRAYPWDERVVDWSAPITDEYLYMPDEYSFLYGTPLWERLLFRDKSFVTRWEFTSLMRNAGAGEHLLNQAILAVLHHTDQYDPAWRYMLHECAEECQHMAMFNSWVRLNPDIKTYGLGDDRWGLFASVMTPVLATKFPVFFWMLTMLLEITGDDMGHAQARNAGGHLHPIVQQIGKAHNLEEVRHIAFARRWVEVAWPKLDKINRVFLSETAERMVGRLLKGGGLPLFYTKQLQPYMTREEFNRAVHSGHRREIFKSQVRPTIRTLNEIGVIRNATLRRWEKMGLVASTTN